MSDKLTKESIERMYEEHADKIAPRSTGENIGITCTLSGPGRGDCEHFIGYPSPIHIPNQHDGPDDTVDAYGKPNGWCWTCWKSRQLEQLREQIDAATKEAVVIKALTIELTKQLAAERERYETERQAHYGYVRLAEQHLSEAQQQLADEREKCDKLSEQRDEAVRLLAAERSKVKELEERLKIVTELNDSFDH